MVMMGLKRVSVEVEGSDLVEDLGLEEWKEEEGVVL